MGNPNIDWNRINDIVSSRGFENVAGLAGAFLKSKGENDRADAMRGATNEQVRARLLSDHSHFAANLAAELDQARKSETLSRAVAAMQATKLGENENFATRNRILSSVLPNARGGNFKPGDAGVAAAMGERPGMFANGIPPEALAAISEGATANAIANRSRQLLNIDPNTATPNFAGMGFSPDAENFGLDAYRAQLLEDRDSNAVSLEDKISRALAQDYEGIMSLPGDQPEEKKQGFWGKFGNVLKVAAPVAAAFIPGVGPLAAAAIAGAGSAAGTKLSGGSWGDAALAGGLGAASGYGAKRLPTGGPRPGAGQGYGVLRGR